MKNILIKGEKDVYFVPSVDFDWDTGICEIAGESYLEETAEFYMPLIEWINDFTDKMPGPLIFNFRLTYFNTSSSRSIVDLLSSLKEFEEEGGDLTVNWYYNETEVDIEDVEDFESETGVEINVKYI